MNTKVPDIEDMYGFTYEETQRPLTDKRVIFVPESVLAAARVGAPTLYGWIHESGVAVSAGEDDGSSLVGSTGVGPPSEQFELFGGGIPVGGAWIDVSSPQGWVRDSDGGWREADLHVYDLDSAQFARSQGLVRRQIVEESAVLVVGAGSVGASLANLLCQQGVGELTILDHDRLEPENVARHLLDHRAVGRFKATAVAEWLRIRNPNVLARGVVENALDPRGSLAGEAARADLVVCAADSLLVRRVVNEECVRQGTAAVFVGFYEHAVASEVIFVLPGETACLACIHGDPEGEPGARSEVPYADEVDEPGEPGLSIDIAEGVNKAAAIALALLDSGGERARALHPNANRILMHAGLVPSGDFSGDFAEPFQVRWVLTERRSDCPQCGLDPDG